MVTKPEADVEFDRRKGEVGVALAELAEEHGRSVVRAAAFEWFGREIQQDSRAEFREQYDGGE